MIFVHVDGKTQMEIFETQKNIGISAVQYLSNLTGMMNIRYVGHEFHSERYSFELILSEIHLFRRACETGKYTAYHLT